MICFCFVSLIKRAVTVQWQKGSHAANVTSPDFFRRAWLRDLPNCVCFFTLKLEVPVLVPLLSQAETVFQIKNQADKVLWWPW